MTPSHTVVEDPADPKATVTSISLFTASTDAIVFVPDIAPIVMFIVSPARNHSSQKFFPTLEPLRALSDTSFCVIVEYHQDHVPPAGSNISLFVGVAPLVFLIEEPDTRSATSAIAPCHA